MREVIVFAEGQTEEKFIKETVAPALRHLQIFLKPQLLKTSQTSKGGAVSIDRLKVNARNTLLQNPDVILSTFLDLYALDTSFPGHADAQKCSDVYKKVAHLENALSQSITAEVNCRPDRFIPHIQPYEFEGLLFSDVNALCAVEPSWNRSHPQLTKIRQSAETPEHINEGPETAPSKRLAKFLSPTYKKTRHGPQAARRITLEVIEKECLHFHNWIETLRKLK